MKANVDKAAIESLFRFRFIYEPLTIYENFKKIPAGSILTFNSHGAEIRKWFSLNNKVSKNNNRYNKKKFLI